MNQSRLGSLIEALLNTFIGFGISVTANAFILPLYGFNVTWQDNLSIGAIFTLISILRSYILRRWFNSRLHQASLLLAKKAHYE